MAISLTISPSFIGSKSLVLLGLCAWLLSHGIRMVTLIGIRLSTLVSLITLRLLVLVTLPLISSLVVRGNGSALLSMKLTLSGQFLLWQRRWRHGSLRH